MKNIKLGIFSLLFSMPLFAADNAQAELKSLQDEINGGADRPISVYVRPYNNAIVLEGSVDSLVQRDIAKQNCVLHAQYNQHYKKRGFKDPESMCVVRIRVRPAAPMLPGINLRVEYKLVFLPDTNVNVDALMSMNFEEGSDVLKDAKLLGSIGVKLTQDVAGNLLAIGDRRLAEANATPPAVETFELMAFDSAAKAFFDSTKKYVLSSKTRAISHEGTDKLALNAEILLHDEGGANPVFKIHTNLNVVNGTLTPIGVLSRLQDKKVAALVLVARVTKVRD